jgi:3-phytase
MRGAITLIAATALASCASVPPGTFDTPASSVTARGETVPVGTGGNADAADDPAIWRNPGDPAASLIVATDKKAGLHVYGLDGKSRFFDPAGQLNNVDLATLPDGRVLVAASDRNDLTQAQLRLYWLAPSGTLTSYGAVPGGAGEGYGLCLWQSGTTTYAYSVLKDGTVEQVRIDTTGEAARGETVRTMKIATQTEGCVVDPRTRTLYVGEEMVGIWRFGAAADAPVAGELVARVDGQHLTADVEGLTLAPQGADGGWLIASSQGDNAYALYRLPDMAPAGRFRIVAGTLGAAEETDGIALEQGDFGEQFPGGLFVAQDGFNKPAQNFKLVAWDDILAALAAE